MDGRYWEERRFVRNRKLWSYMERGGRIECAGGRNAGNGGRSRAISGHRAGELLSIPSGPEHRFPLEAAFAYGSGDSDSAEARSRARFRNCSAADQESVTRNRYWARNLKPMVRAGGGRRSTSVSSHRGT